MREESGESDEREKVGGKILDAGGSRAAGRRVGEGGS